MAVVRLYQFLNGDLVIAEELRESLLEVEVKNPLRILLMPPAHANDTKASIAFAPFCEFTRDVEFTFKRDHIVAIMNPVQQFLNQYQQTFGHVITPKIKPLILPGA